MSNLARNRFNLLAAAMLAGCGSPPATEPAPIMESVSGAGEPERIAEEAPPPPAPPPLFGDDEISERVRARIAELGASGRTLSGSSDGAALEVELTLGASTLRVHHARQAFEGLSALAALARLREGSIAWLEVTRVRGNDLWLSETLAEADADLLTMPWWMVAPSRRRGRPPALAADPGPATGTVEGVGTDIDAVRVDATTSVMLLGTLSDPEAPQGAALCVVRAEAARCVPTELVGIEGLVGAWPGAWALVAEDAVGSSRDSSRAIVLVAETEQGVVVEQLLLGASAGDGEACEDVEGYCVSVTASASNARWVADRCLEVDAPTSWTAEHVRLGDRWRGEEIRPPADCARRYEIGVVGWVRTRCGPAGGRPECGAD